MTRAKLTSTVAASVLIGFAGQAIAGSCTLDAPNQHDCNGAVRVTNSIVVNSNAPVAAQPYVAQNYNQEVQYETSTYQSVSNYNENNVQYTSVPVYNNPAPQGCHFVQTAPCNGGMVAVDNGVNVATNVQTNVAYGYGPSTMVQSYAGPIAQNYVSSYSTIKNQNAPLAPPPGYYYPAIAPNPYPQAPVTIVGPYPAPMPAPMPMPMPAPCFDPRPVAQIAPPISNSFFMGAVSNGVGYPIVTQYGGGGGMYMNGGSRFSGVVGRSPTPLIPPHSNPPTPPHPPAPPPAPPSPPSGW